MSVAALMLKCCCGGEMDYVGPSFVVQRSEREAFNLRHANCKPEPKPVQPPARRYRIAGRR